MHQQKWDELQKIIEVLESFQKPLNVLHDELSGEYQDLDDDEKENEDGEELSANVESINDGATKLEEAIDSLKGVTGPE